MATQQFAANVLRTGARKAGRSAPVRATHERPRGGLRRRAPIDLRGASLSPRPGVRDGESARDRASPSETVAIARFRRPSGGGPRRPSSPGLGAMDDNRMVAPAELFVRAASGRSNHPAAGALGGDTCPAPPSAHRLTFLSRLLPVTRTSTGKKAFVAGVADDQGFGWAISKCLAQAGCEVILGTWVPALNIFETSLRRGKFDESRKLSDGSLMEFAKVYPMDAVYDTYDDVPEDVRTNKRYAGN